MAAISSSSQRLGRLARSLQCVRLRVRAATGADERLSVVITATANASPRFRFRCVGVHDVDTG